MKSKLLSDDNRKNLTGLILGAGVELLAELHDIDTLGAQSGTYWRRGIGRAAFNLQFDLSSNFFCHC